jgi:pyridoxamine 5'-phosphate oxidase family protein
MIFNDLELEYIKSRSLARLATVQPNGTVQVNPITYRFDDESSVFEIGGFDIVKSRKYRNIADNGKVALVIDDVVSTDPWRIRCLEIRGKGTVEFRPEAFPDLDPEIIRIHPQRIISFGIDSPDKEPHELVSHNRNVS